MIEEPEVDRRLGVADVEGWGRKEEAEGRGSGAEEGRGLGRVSGLAGAGNKKEGRGCGEGRGEEAGDAVGR
jgi:hypothetical protein